MAGVDAQARPICFSCGRKRSQASPLDRERLRNNLIYWRRRRGLSQRDLSYLAGVKLDTISAIEQRRSSPQNRTILDLAWALSVSPENLWFDLWPTQELRYRDSAVLEHLVD